MSIPTISLATASTQSPAASDRTLAIVAAASVAVSVVALLARLAGLLPDGPAALIVIVAAAVGLKVALTYAAKSASSAARARVMNLVSTVALAISGITVLASLPHLTKAAGMHPFVVDLVAQSWTLAILLIVAGPVRTIGWRGFAGAGLTGLLGTTALARLVGRPLVEKLGASSILATSSGGETDVLPASNPVPNNDGSPTANPDGTTTVRNPDGSTTTTLPSPQQGIGVTVNDDGSVTHYNEDGSTTTEVPPPQQKLGVTVNDDGSVTHYNEDGSTTTDVPPKSGGTASTSPGSTGSTDPDDS